MKHIRKSKKHSPHVDKEVAQKHSNPDADRRAGKRSTSDAEIDDKRRMCALYIYLNSFNYFDYLS